MRKSILLICLTFFSAFSKAGISLEPYIGLGLGFLSQNKKTYYIGSSPGIRLGYSRWGLMLGVDLSYLHYRPFSTIETISNPIQGIIQTSKRGINQLLSPKSNENQNLIQSSASKYNAFAIGPSVSFGLPLIIDAYASLMYAGARTSDKSDKFRGIGLKTGVSYLNLPFVSVNIELQVIHYYCLNEEASCSQDKQQMYMVFLYLSSPINTGFP